MSTFPDPKEGCMLKKIVVTGVAAGVLVAAPAGAALAHDCFVVNRSAQGSAGAAHSGKWSSFTLKQALSEFLNVPAANVQAAYDEAVAAGIPKAFATRTDTVLLEGTAADANGRTADGKGIDHFSESPIIAKLFEIALKYGGHP